MASGIKRSTAIKRFLTAVTHPDLAALYTPDMEVQVNVAQDEGVRKDATNDTGVRTIVWTDGTQSWSSFRLPRNAMSEPEDNDFEINFEIDKHTESIGMTGWNWKERKSYWFAFDFDAIAGHSEKHAATLTDTQLEAVKQAAMEIPWVTVRKSTGGKGLHLYVFVDGIDTANHNEHAALARSVLGMMSAITGFDFGGSVDACGGNIWVWGRKMKGTDGLSLIKKGETLYDIPPNWQDHVKVTSSRGKMRNLPQFIDERELSLFEELAGQRPRVPLDDDHKKLIEYMTEKKCFWWWDNDHHMMVCHTYDLKLAHSTLQMRGLFDTVALGRQSGGDHNCFCFPMRRGAWAVRRYTKGINEHSSWDQDANGWTRCFLNKDPDLQSAARAHGGVEQEKGGFEFREAEVAMQAAKALGVQLDVGNHMMQRNTILKPHRDGRLIVKIKKEKDDNPNKMIGWREEKDGTWTRIYNVNVENRDQESEVANFDDAVRHLISESGEDAGWVIRGEETTWNVEPLAHVKVALGSTGMSGKQVGEVLGAAVRRPWRLVNKPFRPEYPGDRQWNRNSAQLRFTPSAEVDKVSFPHWWKVLNHCGASLNEAIAQHQWCKDNGISTGGEYLLYWCAFMFKDPLRKMPYLFFYGPQESGKSVFHESLALLFERKRGYMRADAALTSPAAFNGELENVVFGVIEETDLSRHGSTAYNRIKDWTTGVELLIHRKNHTPYSVANLLHLAQFANDKTFCPIFKDDTRITMSYVPSLLPGEEIPKDTLLALLEKEAPDFLAYMLALDLPNSGKRLGLPIINTQDKMDTARANQTMLETFMEERTFRVDGEAIKLGDLYQQFKDWLDPAESEGWTKQRMTSELPPETPKGRYRGPDWYIGNISWQARHPETPIKAKLVRKGEKLVSEDEVV